MAMDNKEAPEVLASEEIYHGRIFDVSVYGDDFGVKLFVVAVIKNYLQAGTRVEPKMVAAVLADL